MKTASIHKGAIPFMGVQMVALIILTLLPESVVPGLLDQGVDEIGDQIGGEEGQLVEDLLRGIGRGLKKDKDRDRR